MSSSDIETERAFRAFVPTKIELIALPLVGLLFLTLSNSFQLLRSVDGNNYQLIIDFIEAQVESFLSAVDRLVGSTAPLVLFWMFVGIVVYVLLWLGLGIYNAYRSDLPNEKGMVVPRDYNHARVLRGGVAHMLVRVIAGALLITWVVLLFTEVLPYASQLFVREVENISLLTLAYAMLATLVLSAWLFTIMVLCRCVVLRDRVFG